MLLACSCLAQVQTRNNDNKEVVQRSPFTVDASRDVGYRATATTAWSRLNPDLKDVAASLTVLTSEFMDDLGADNLADALSMVVGADSDFTTDVSDPRTGITTDRASRYWQNAWQSPHDHILTANYIP